MITYDDDNFRTEGEVAETLAVFDTDYVFGLIDIHLRDRLKIHFSPLPNIVNSFNIIFNNIKIQFPTDIENTKIKEEEVYSEIINHVSTYSNLNFNEEQATDSKFIIASVLYDVMVVNFSKYFIEFLYNIIIKEKKNIYNYLSANNLIRDKDCETIYNLKVMDNKAAIILANFDRAINCLMELDIGFDEFIKQLFYFDQKHIFEIMLYNFNYNGNFFSDILKIIVNDNNLFPVYINDIRLKFMGV